MRAFVLVAALGALTVASAASAQTAIQLTNSDFEVGAVFDPGDGVGIGHANLPAPWTSPAPGDGAISGDTWSHLGAPRGLFPTVNGVFPATMLAYGGDRWAGGWDFEYISQPVTQSIIAGNDYFIIAAIHASNLGPGGSIEVSFGTSVSDRSFVAGVFPGFVTLNDGWQTLRLDFTATAAMATATWFHFRAFNPAGTHVYVAVDAIPAPAGAGLYY